jgi:hypothetical protein
VFMIYVWYSVVPGQAGSAEWTAEFALDGQVQPFQSLTQDQEANVYVSGGAEIFGKGHVALIVKYLADGTEAWSRTYQTATNALNSVYGLTVNRRGEVSAIISTAKPEGLRASVVRLDSEGNLIGGWEYPGLLSAAVGDLDANTFIFSGLLQNAAGGYDSVLTKYDANGLRVWERGGAFPQPEPAAARLLAIDRAGKVYAAGGETSISKYSRHGDHLWAANLSGASPTGLVLDKQQNVYVTGFRGQDDTLTVKVDSKGRELWRSSFRSPEGSPTQPLDIAANEKGETFIVTSNPSTYSVIKYDALGQIIWVKEELGSPYFGYARLGVDKLGGAWLWYTSLTDHAVLVHYDEAGRRAHLYETAPDGLEWGGDMLVGERAEILVTSYLIDRRGAVWVTRMLAQ